MKPRTPQEKKALSYARDRRNCYGENDKSSRKAIRKNKVLPSRAYRRNVNQLLQHEAAGIDAELAEFLDSDLRAIKRRIWKKAPDMPLGEFVRRQLEHRRNTYQARIRRRLEKR